MGRCRSQSIFSMHKMNSQLSGVSESSQKSRGSKADDDEDSSSVDSDSSGDRSPKSPRRRMICSVCSKSQSNLSPMEAAALNSSGNSAAANAALSQQLKDKDREIGKLQDELTKTHEALSKKRAEARKKQELQDDTCTAENVGDGC